MLTTSDALAAPTFDDCGTDNPWGQSYTCPGTSGGRLCHWNNATSQVECDTTLHCDDSSNGAVAWLIENDTTASPTGSTTDYVFRVECEGGSTIYCCEIDDSGSEADLLTIVGTDQRDFLYLAYKDSGSTLHPLGPVDAGNPITGEIKAGQGDDFLVASSYTGGGMSSVLRGEADDDDLRGLSDQDTCYGGSGLDFVDGGPAADTVNGDGSADIVAGNGGADVLHGNDGDDKMCDGNYYSTDVPSINDVFAHTASGDPATYDVDCIDDNQNDADAVYGDGDADDIYCFDGDDAVDAGSGDDTVTTGDGDDDVQLGSGLDVATTGAGQDDICAPSTDSSYADEIYAEGDNDDVFLGYGQSLTGQVEMGGQATERCNPYGSPSPYTTSGGGTLTDCTTGLNACPI